MDKYKMLNKKHRFYKNRFLLKKPNNYPSSGSTSTGGKKSTLNVVFGFLRRSVPHHNTKRNSAKRDEPHTEEREAKRSGGGKGRVHFLSKGRSPVKPCMKQ